MYVSLDVIFLITKKLHVSASSGHYSSCSPTLPV